MILQYSHIPDVEEPDDSVIFTKLQNSGWKTDPRTHSAELEVRTPMEGMIAWKTATELDPEPGHKFWAISASSSRYWYSYAIGGDWILG